MQAIEEVHRTTSPYCRLGVSPLRTFWHLSRFIRAAVSLKVGLINANTLIKRLQLLLALRSIQGSCKGVLYLDDFILGCGLVAQSSA